MRETDVRRPGRPRVRRGIAALIAALSFASVIGTGPLVVPVQAAGPLAGIKIALDPGHNGGNAAHPEICRRQVFTGTGWRACATVGTTTVSGFPEHRLNWLVAQRVKVRLEALGATVVMTRTSNTGVGPCVDVRGRFGTNQRARLTVAIHADGSASSHRGFYVMRPALVKGYTDDIYTTSSRLATAIKSGLLGAGLPLANYYAAPSGIRTRSDFATFNFSNIPTVMVELGNMKNASDAARMTTTSGRDRYALGLVSGIRIYLGRQGQQGPVHVADAAHRRAAFAVRS
jgi:N-acetylmuramoyl-L-alanine amidase